MDIFQQEYGLRQKRRRFLQALAKEGLLARDQRRHVRVMQLQPLPNRHLVGDAHEVLLVEIPVELDPQRL